MPVLCFVLDTSASMNRRTAQGQRVIDLAKTAIDNFLKKVENLSKIPITRNLAAEESHFHSRIRHTPRKDKTRDLLREPSGETERHTQLQLHESFNALEFLQILPALFCVILACAVYTLVSALARVAQNSR